MVKIFDVGKPKKASLNLSLNAIVILILAIAMLGLGLTFIRGIFKNITGKVEEAVSAGEITNPPNRDKPITITPPKVELRAGGKVDIKVAFMNVEADPNDFSLEVWPSGADESADGPGYPCSIDGPCAVPMVFNDQPLSMNKDQINIWTVAVTPDSGSLIGGEASHTYLYTTKMVSAGGGAYTRDFIVVVKS